MEELNLPIIKDKARKVRRITLDQHLKLVMDNLRHTVDLTAFRKRKKPPFVYEKFVIK